MDSAGAQAAGLTAENGDDAVQYYRSLLATSWPLQMKATSLARSRARAGPLAASTSRPQGARPRHSAGRARHRGRGDRVGISRCTKAWATTAALCQARPTGLSRLVLGFIMVEKPPWHSPRSCAQPSCRDAASDDPLSPEALRAMLMVMTSRQRDGSVPTSRIGALAMPALDRELDRVHPRRGAPVPHPEGSPRRSRGSRRETTGRSICQGAKADEERSRRRRLDSRILPSDFGVPEDVASERMKSKGREHRQAHRAHQDRSP